MVMLSIIVPIYNKSAYLENSLRSITSGSLTHFQVIMVDDGSTDGSSDIAKSWAEKDKRFKYVRQDNQGLSAARNRGIKEAETKWVTFHDADDLLHPDAIAALIHDAEKEEVDIAAGVFQRKNGDNIRIDKAFQTVHLIENFEHDAKLAKKFCTHFSCCNKIFSSHIFKEHRFQPGLYMQDIDFWLRVLFAKYRFLQTEHVVATYVAHQESESRQRKNERFESLFQLYNGLKDYYQKKELDAQSPIWQFALLQGAIAFFARWKLEDNNHQDLDRICDLLNDIPEIVFEDFFNEKNRGNIIPILISIRNKNYSAAKMAHELGPQYFRQNLNRPSTLEEIYTAANTLSSPSEPSFFTKIRTAFKKA